VPIISMPVLALAGAYLALRAQRYGGDGSGAPMSGSDNPIEGPAVDLRDIPIEELEGWTFPVPAWGDYHAMRSQEFRRGPVPGVDTAGAHWGVDIMYPRASHGTASDRVYKAGTPNGSKSGNWFMPDGVPVLCPRAGKVWNIGIGEHGPYVTIDCGKPFAIYMVHFDQMLLSSKGQPVAEGQMIGTIGYSPRDAAKLKHLHIEVYRNGPRSAAVDPWPYLAQARRT
jgi:murein DD-endopeptidase MepM/ murein hydrolase activator NlpD